MSDSKQIRLTTNDVGTPKLVVNFLKGDAGKLELLLSKSQVVALVKDAFVLLIEEGDLDE